MNLNKHIKTNHSPTHSQTRLPPFPPLTPRPPRLSQLAAESGLTYTQSEMGVDGESGWRVVMTSQTVGRLPALSRPARDEPTDTTDNREVRTATDAATHEQPVGARSRVELLPTFKQIFGLHFYFW